MVDFVEFTEDGEKSMDDAVVDSVVDTTVAAPVEDVSAEVEFEAAAAAPEHGTNEYWVSKIQEDGGHWRPKEEYTGDPDLFVDAKEYYQRGKLMQPYKDALHKRDKDIDDIRRKTSAMLIETQRQERKKYEGLLVQAKQNEKIAFDNADFDGVDKARTAAEQIKQGIHQIDQGMQQQPAEMPPEQGEAYDSFLDANKSWYGVDTEKTELAEALGKGIGDRLIGQKIQAGADPATVSLTAAEYKGILSKVAAQFSGTPGRPRVSTVQPASGMRPSRSQKVGFGELPSDAKSAFNTMFRHGTFGKDRQKAEQRYAADYHNDSPYGAE